MVQTPGDLDVFVGVGFVLVDIMPPLMLASLGAVATVDVIRMAFGRRAPVPFAAVGGLAVPVVLYFGLALARV
jgi:hypothetical protein